MFRSSQAAAAIFARARGNRHGRTNRHQVYNKVSYPWREESVESVSRAQGYVQAILGLNPWRVLRSGELKGSLIEQDVLYVSPTADTLWESGDSHWLVSGHQGNNSTRSARRGAKVCYLLRDVLSHTKTNAHDRFS